MPELISLELAFFALIVSECAIIDAFERRRWAENREGTSIPPLPPFQLN
jgi:hypothetical protein